MAALIAGYVAALFFLALTLLGRGRVEQQANDADEERAADLRRFAESPWPPALFGSWALLAVVAGVFLLMRDYSIGWAWFGVAALFAVDVALSRQNNRRVLATLGERGKVERAARYKSRAAVSRRWAAAAFTFFIAARIVPRAYPEGMTDGAEVVFHVLTIVTYACGLVFLALRARMWLQGDDLERPEHSSSSSTGR